MSENKQNEPVNSLEEAQDPALDRVEHWNWHDDAFAKLGANRHKMHPNDIEAVQRFLASEFERPLPDDEAVDKFAQAMKEKLAQARDKGRSGWQHCDPADLSAMLYEHVAKGDPRDVANFCMFLWNLGQPITQCHKSPSIEVTYEPVVLWMVTKTMFAGCQPWVETFLTKEQAQQCAAQFGGQIDALCKCTKPVKVNEQMLDALKDCLSFLQSDMPTSSSRREKNKATAAIEMAEAAKKGGVK